MERVCQQIKIIRNQKKMTLKDLSIKTELSISFLSQIERGTTSLALSSLQKIADAFEVDISVFFNEPKKNKFMVKENEQEPYQISGLESRYTRLNGEFPQRSLAPFLVTMAPFQRRTQTFTHPGEEFYYVLKGSVVFEVGEEHFFMKKGDSIHFPSDLPHFGENPSDEETILLCCITPVIF